MAAAEMAASAVKTAVTKGLKEMHGVVVSAGLMDKTVKVRLGGQRWEPRVHKNFKEPRFHLVHDPRNSVRQGDIVSITPSWRVAQHVRHVVKHIIKPYGEAIEARPAVPTLEERIEERATKRAAKDARRSVILAERARVAEEERLQKVARREKKRAAAARAAAQGKSAKAETSIDDVD